MQSENFNNVLSAAPFLEGEADVAVVGAGHAGVEAALAAARLGRKTVLFTLSLDAVANLPCNPSIGGTGKGQLVFEIDALGGEMGRAADAVTLQDRMLNTGKGAAVRSKRIQADRTLYRDIMKKTLEATENLSVVQAQIVDIVTEPTENGRRLIGVVTRLGALWRVRAAVICTGTYLDSRVITGETIYSSGPDGMQAAPLLSVALRREGIGLLRFKTGTPPRIAQSSVELSRLEPLWADEEKTPFSVLTDPEKYQNRPSLPCYIVYTNENTHRVIRENLSRSPLYSGEIKGTGPRYCPSIEDKIVRFSDKERHQLFLEPTSDGSDEAYLQGFSSSMPYDVQLKMLHTLPGFENARVMRAAYAIEYDCIDSLQLCPTLEFREIAGLYGAGQFNGTSGYEEAAAQGLVAGINAALSQRGEKQLVLPRSSSYIGTLIDDLVTKGTGEPYRMMTSRSEYRLMLRQDNADLRLTEIGRKIGLVSDGQYEIFTRRREAVAAELARLHKTVLPPCTASNAFLAERGEPALVTGVRLDELLRRPDVDYASLAVLDVTRPRLDARTALTVQTEIKYGGYIKKQEAEIRRTEKMEAHPLPAEVDYMKIEGLSIEARQKLSRFRPHTLGEATRISGVSPADISVLMITFGIV